MFFFFHAEDGIRDAQESRGLGDVYKRQAFGLLERLGAESAGSLLLLPPGGPEPERGDQALSCLLYTSEAADDLLCVDLGGRRIIKKKIYVSI